MLNLVYLGGKTDMAMKYRQLANLLREDLLKGNDLPGRRLPSEAELCQRYRMSRQTVRHALSVLEDEGLVEKRRGSGTYTTGKIMDDLRRIAVVAAYPDDYIFPSILHDIKSLLSDNGYSTLVFSTGGHIGAERDILQKLLDLPVSGIIVEGSRTALPTPNVELYRKLQLAQIPILFLHGAYKELGNVIRVCDDNYGGGYRLASYLIDKGRHNIAGIFKSDDIQGPQRYHGTITAIKDVGLDISERFFSWYDTLDRYEMLALHDTRFLQHCIRNRLEGADAVVCYNDEIACLLIRELISMGRKVPEDISVVSFDNSFYTELSPVHITSLWHKNSRTGQTAAELLLQSINGENPASRTLSWELVQRASG